jgi:hydrogenase maturation protease
MGRILILGLGNILLKDEGLGVKVVRELQEEFTFSEEVELLDGGTGAFFLLPHLEKAERLIIVDAVKRGALPGTLTFEALESLPKDTLERLSLHEISFPDLLKILELRGKKFEKIILAGIEPKNLDAGLELSEEVKRVIPELKKRIIALLKEWGVPLQRMSKLP